MGNVSTSSGEQGFILDQGGTPTYVVPPGKIFIELQRGNNAGQVAGAYLSPDDFKLYAFIRNPNGSIHEVGFPGALTTVGGQVTNRGDLLGSYTNDPTGVAGWVTFIEHQGTFPFTFTYPDPDSSGTIGLGINDLGAIVGVYTKQGSPTLHAFVRRRIGDVFEIQYPGSVENYVSGNNNWGVAVGYWLDTSGVYHGLIYAEGLCYTLDRHGDPSGFKNTTLLDINNFGELVGVSFQGTPSDGNGFTVTHGYRSFPEFRDALPAGTACVAPGAR